MTSVIRVDGAWLKVLEDMVEARIDAVLPPFKLQRTGELKAFVQYYDDKHGSELVIRVPVRLREYVGG